MPYQPRIKLLFRLAGLPIEETTNEKNGLCVLVEPQDNSLRAIILGQGEKKVRSLGAIVC